MNFQNLNRFSWVVLASGCLVFGFIGSADAQEKIVAKINAAASYRHALMLFFGITALTLILGNVLIGSLVGFLASLPV